MKLFIEHFIKPFNKPFIKLLFLSLVLMLSACSVFESQSESREVGTFDKLEISGLAEVIITQADQQALMVKVSGMPITDVITTIVSRYCR